MINPKFLHNGDPWMLAEDIPEIDFQFSQIWLSSFVNDLKKTVGRNYTKILSVYKGCSLKFYYGENDSNNFAKHVLGQITKNPAFGQKINEKIRFFSDKLRKNSKKITPVFLSQLSNLQLSQFYIDFDKLHTTLYTWGWLPNSVDMFHGNFTDYIKSLLSKRISIDEINPALVALSVSAEKSVVQKEYESFLRLVALKQTDQSTKRLHRAIESHMARYFYLRHLWLNKNGVYDFDYYTQEIKKFIDSGRDAKKLLRQGRLIFRRSIIDRMKLIQQLQFDLKTMQIFDVYADFAVTKSYRRDAQIYWAYKMDLVFDELVKRLTLSVMQVRFMFPEEIAMSLKNGSVTDTLKSELKQRIQDCVYYAEEGTDIITVGTQALRMKKEVMNQVASDIDELSGQTACLGQATGVVKIVNIIADMAKMNRGDILVSIATNPDIVPAMQKSAAIVTEQGGVTSHAAIVAREFGIPCIIGTKIATKVLQDGDLIEVDANKGIVKVIRKVKL
jgi:phosphohistidine swiveling domain-containing protein